MKSIEKLLAVFVAITFSLYGCGGDSSSPSTTEEIQEFALAAPETTPKTESKPAPKTTPPLISGLPNSIEINPLRDLGLEKGKNICFRLKSYNNVAESDFSKVICSQIKNDRRLTLSWSDVPGNVSGYFVYYGVSKNNATKFLIDVIES